MKVESGHNVQVHYKGTLKDGTEFDNSRERGQPLDFQVGSGRMIRGFNDAVVGMEVGETKSAILSPEHAYGPRDPEATQVVPKEAFGEDFEFIIGGTIQGNGPAGPFFAKIQEVAGTEVTLDMNHPLAGEELNFEIELLSVEGVTMSNWNATMKKAELLEVAKSKGLKVNTRSTKAQIINALSA